MPPFVDDPVNYPDDLRLVRILKNRDFWHPKDAPSRASSGAFCDTSKQNSCFVLGGLAAEHFAKIANIHPVSKLAVITAGQARESGYSVIPGHVVVCPPQNVRNHDYIRMAKRLAHRSVMYTPPE